MAYAGHDPAFCMGLSLFATYYSCSTYVACRNFAVGFAQRAEG